MWNLNIFQLHRVVMPVRLLYQITALLVTDMFITHLQKQNLQNFHHDNTLTPNTS